jgi:hypothetical protein
VPDRARVSPSGHVLTWTVFVTGDSYRGGRFATRVGLLNTVTGETVDSLESFAVTRDGRPYRNADLNFWGVTFADDQHFGGNPDRGWRLGVLDLATLRRTPLAETRSVDDQAAWYDEDTVMYAVRRGPRAADVWSVPADGGGAAHLLIPDAASPAALWNYSQ